MNAASRDKAARDKAGPSNTGRGVAWRGLAGHGKVFSKGTMMIEAQRKQEVDRDWFQRSAETRLCYGRLRKLEKGETALYAEVTSLIGMDAQTDGYAIVASARRIALRDDGIVTVAVPNVGIKRLTDTEIAHSGADTFSRARRLVGRGARRLMAAQDEHLSESDRGLRNASLAAMAVMKLMTKPKSVERIAAANTSAGELPIARTLELFRGPRRQ